MLRELIHLARHAPSVLALQQKLDQTELYDTLMQRADDAGMYARRSALVSDLHLLGRGAPRARDVLEIGCGTGMMFAHYGEGARVRAIDVDDAFLERARTRARSFITLENADALALPMPDASFDAVVACLVLCSIPDARRALAEARRVLRPGGELRLIEHVVSDRRVPRALMHAADPLWLWLNHQGCHMDRDTVASVREVFPNVEITERFQIWSAGLPAFPMLTLRAPK
ncbi:MAG TPA: class I SAM-dependent methyltransferase [Polyangiaceae bacterium]|jgi:SAM-dependent methyltransferase